MKELVTDPCVLASLQAAAQKPVSQTELRRQKIDFIVTLFAEGAGITRARVELELMSLAGRDDPALKT